jgi:diguanylate cyclase (GGDEF)-like protein/PAS domain S-box-containing protein
MRARPAIGGPETSLFGGIRPMLAGMILVAILPLVAVRAVELYQERDHQTELAGGRALDLARRGAALFREPMAEAGLLLKVLSEIPAVASGTAKGCSQSLHNALLGRDWASDFWVIDRSGLVICATSPDQMGAQMGAQEYFQRAVTRRQSVISNLFPDPTHTSPKLVIAAPVIGEDGDVERVLAASVRLGRLAEIAAAIGRPADARVILFDGDDNLLARHPDRPEWIGGNWRGSTPAVETARSREGWGLMDSPDGKAQIYAWSAVAGTPTRIAVGFDAATVFAHIDSQIRRATAVVVFAVVLALLAGVALARRVSGPLAMLTAGAEAVRASREAELPVVTGFTEVESLAASLNQLLADRRQREDALSIARAEAERAENEARAAHARLRDALEAVPVGLVFFDADDRYLLWNARYMELYPHITDPPVVGEKFDERLRAGIPKGYFPQAAGREEEWLAHRLALHRDFQSSHEQLLPGNRWLRIEERRTSDGGSIGIRVDITEAKRREESTRLLFAHNPIPMWVCDRDTLRILAVNDAAISHYGYSRERFLAMTILDLHPEDERALPGDHARSEEPSLGKPVRRHVKADGTCIHVSVFSRAMLYDGRPAKIAAAIDVTERERAEARITHMAHHDGLTDLANRILFRDRLEQALARPRHSSRGLALHCIDLDFFKDVNDTLGHPIGDELLRLVADRLRGCVGDADTVARLGGDEFAVIQETHDGADGAGRLAKRLIETLSAPYHIDYQEVVVAASIGIALAGDGERDPDRLLKNADVALYRAKADGRRAFRFFVAEMDSRLQARRTLDRDLRAALQRREFELHYQPAIELQSGETVGFEALLRWHHPERGTVSPAEFIPLAEETGLIVPLGDWVLQDACRQAAQWPNDVTIAVNLSPLQFRSGGLVETVKNALAVSGLPGRRLELEITETVLFHDNDVNLTTLHELRALGVRIAMDDFGTGYSSLSYLRRFPFDKIKIDRSFVKELPHDPDCLTIIRGVVALASGLGMATTAEGVETKSQFEVLRAYGCREAQGFLFGAAAPAADAVRRLRGRRSVGTAA